MPLEYKSQIGLDVIMPVLDEYIVWYGKIMRSYFEGKPSLPTPPQVFDIWVTGAGLSDMTEQRVRRIHEGMVDAAKMFITKYGARENPPLHEFNELTGHYEEFIQFMRRLELEQATEHSGFDERTGLRSSKLMKDDIARELERRARRGNPFCLALIKINKFDAEWQKNETSFRGMIVRIADQLKECLRSFDDAYYMGGEYFLLSLKHADLLGSQAALNRLNKAIATAHIPVPDDPIEEISVSSVLSEPAPGDSLDTLLGNMKKDLGGIDEKGAILQYNEMSPIQRYMLSMEKGK